MSTFPSIEEILKDRVKYGFLPDDDDNDVRAIVTAENHHDISGHSLSNPDILTELQQAAKNYNLARRTVTFKPQEQVLRKFKERAEKEGIPYQALLNSVMKKYAEGSLVQKEEMYTVK